jgi:hypothetical protein
MLLKPLIRSFFDHIGVIALIVIFSVLAFPAFDLFGKRPWWYFCQNDACHGFTAQSISISNGAAIQTVVWPGATLSTIYLFLNSDKQRNFLNSESISEVENLIARGVRFHWLQSFIISLTFLLIFYFLSIELSQSKVLSLFATSLIVANYNFIWQSFVVRPEIPSVAFGMLSCLVICKRQNKLSEIKKVFLSGIFMGIALLSKIQVLPIILLALGLFHWGRKTLNRKWKQPPKPFLFWGSIISISTCLGFLKTKLIRESAYDLASYPALAAHAVCLLSIACIIGLYYLANREKEQKSEQCAQILIYIFGLVGALYLVIFPILLCGGWMAALTSINRILFGMAAYSFYGLKLSSFGGWGFKSSLNERWESFWQFQYSSDLIPGNLALWTAFGLGTSALISYLIQSSQKNKNTRIKPPENQLNYINLAGILLSTGILFDLLATHRTVDNTSYGFYHIYSLPFYILSAICSFSPLWHYIIRFLDSKWYAKVVQCGVTAFLLLLAWQQIRKDAAFAEWSQPIGEVGKYFEQGGSVQVIGSVAPQFWLQTGQSFKSLKAYVENKASVDKK